MSKKKEKATKLAVGSWQFVCSLLETNNSRIQSRASPTFLKEVVEVRSRRIREMIVNG